MHDGYFVGRPLDVETGPQLLMDTSRIEDRWDVDSVVNIPLKHPKNPLVMADRSGHVHFPGRDGHTA